MAFSDNYKAIRGQHAADVATALGLATTTVHIGDPETEQTGYYAILRCETLDSDLDHPVASGNRPGMTIEINGEAFLAYPPSNTVLEDAALVYADALCALVEASPDYAGVGMLPQFTSFPLDGLSGIQEGDGDARLHIRWQFRCFTQRARG